MYNFFIYMCYIYIYKYKITMKEIIYNLFDVI